MGPILPHSLRQWQCAAAHITDLRYHRVRSGKQAPVRGHSSTGRAGTSRGVRSRHGPERGARRSGERQHSGVAGSEQRRHYLESNDRSLPSARQHGTRAAADRDPDSINRGLTPEPSPDVTEFALYQGLPSPSDSTEADGTLGAPDLRGLDRDGEGAAGDTRARCLLILSGLDRRRLAPCCRLHG